MAKQWTVALALGLLAGAALGDSIDDAEAKRRGVPVIVIQLEKQVAVQKQKTADVEKRVAEAQKKIADLENPSARASKAPASLDPQLPHPADGPRKSSPVFDDLAAKYMAGDWTKFTQDLAKAPQLASLPAGNAADLAYMRAAVAECRPAWWARAKAGQPFTIDVTAFNRTIPVNYTPGQEASHAGNKNGKFIFQASWVPGVMDSSNSIAGINSTLLFPAGNYVLGDVTYYAVWSCLVKQLPLVDYGAVKIAELDNQEEKYVADHREFCGTAAGLYYATPNSRYLTLAECVQAFDPDRRSSKSWEGRRQFGAFLLVTLLSHPETYPSLKTDITGLPDERPQGTGTEEYLCTNYFKNKLIASKLTFAEDCALRQAIWEFFMANTDWSDSRIKLPNGLALESDSTKEPQATKDRWTWYVQATQVKPATQPSTEPAAK